MGLPMFSVAISALPFIWHVLDAKLVLTGPGSCKGRRDQDLGIYTKVMKVFKSLYESTDGLLRCTGKIMDFTGLSELWRLSNTKSSTWKSGRLDKTPNAESISDDDWANLLVRLPESYMRIALTIEFLLSYGRLPLEDDFPKSVRVGNSQHTDLCTSKERSISR